MLLANYSVDTPSVGVVARNRRSDSKQTDRFLLPRMLAREALKSNHGLPEGRGGGGGGDKGTLLLSLWTIKQTPAVNWRPATSV